MADDDLGNWFDESYEPEIQAPVIAAAGDDVVDKTLVEEAKAAEKAKEAAAAAALLRPAKSKADEDRERLEAAAALRKKLEGEVLSDPVKEKARQEALVRNADLEFSREALGGGRAGALPAGEADKWSKNIIISGTADIKVLGKSVAETVHKAFPNSPKDAVAFYLELLVEAEEKLTTAELSLIVKRAQTAVNNAKDREMAAKKKAQPAKKSLPKGPRMGGALDSFEDEGSYDAFGEGGVVEPLDGKFTKTAFKQEEDFM